MTATFHRQPAVKGDRFIVDGYFVEVTRVGRTQPWADVRVRSWAGAWTMRLPAGVPALWQRVDWTDADVAASEPYRDEEAS